MRRIYTIIAEDAIDAIAKASVIAADEAADLYQRNGHCYSNMNSPHWALVRKQGDTCSSDADLVVWLKPKDAEAVNRAEGWNI